MPGSVEKQGMPQCTRHVRARLMSKGEGVGLESKCFVEVLKQCPELSKRGRPSLQATKENRLERIYKEECRKTEQHTAPTIYCISFHPCNQENVVGILLCFFLLLLVDNHSYSAKEMVYIVLVRCGEGNGGTGVEQKHAKVRTDAITNSLQLHNTCTYCYISLANFSQFLEWLCGPRVGEQHVLCAERIFFAEQASRHFPSKAQRNTALHVRQKTTGR